MTEKLRAAFDAGWDASYDYHKGGNAYGPVAAFTTFLSALSEQATGQPVAWRLIETAPSGVSTNGKPGVCWMMLCVPDDEGGFHTVSGMRWGDKYYAALTFYSGECEKQYQLRELEVHPTHWMPSLAAPGAAPQAPAEAREVEALREALTSSRSYILYWLSFYSASAKGRDDLARLDAALAQNGGR